MVAQVEPRGKIVAVVGEQHSVRSGVVVARLGRDARHRQAADAPERQHLVVLRGFVLRMRRTRGLRTFRIARRAVRARILRGRRIKHRLALRIRHAAHALRHRWLAERRFGHKPARQHRAQCERGAPSAHVEPLVHATPLSHTTFPFALDVLSPKLSLSVQNRHQLAHD